VLTFGITAPHGEWTRATAVALQGIALLAALLVCPVTPVVRRVVAVAVLVSVLSVAIAAVVADVSPAPMVGVGAVMAAATAALLIVGVARSIRRRGVTRQAVLGAVAVYLLIGGFFTFLIGAIAEIGNGPFFTKGTDGTTADYIYYSFTTLTTTGFGDFSPASAAGRAVAVLEMLVGQFYLVTVISVLVSRFAMQLSIVDVEVEEER